MGWVTVNHEATSGTLLPYHSGLAGSGSAIATSGNFRGMGDRGWVCCPNPYPPTPHPSVFPLRRLELGDGDRLVGDLRVRAGGRGGRRAGVMDEGVLQPGDIVAFGKVVARVSAAALRPVQRRERRRLGQVEQTAQLEGLQQIGVEAPALVVNLDAAETLLQFAHLVHGGLHHRLGAEHADVVHHHLLHFVADPGRLLAAFLCADAFQFADHIRFRAVRQRRKVGAFDELGHRLAAAPAKDHQVHQ